MSSDPFSELSSKELRAAAALASPEIAELLNSLAQAKDQGRPVTPQELNQDPATLLASASALLPQLESKLAPMRAQLQALSARGETLGPLQEQAQEQLRALIDVLRGPRARALTAQAMAQLQSSVQPTELQALLLQAQALAQDLPALLRRVFESPGAATPQAFAEQAAALSKLEQRLLETQTALYGASASLGLAAAVASQDADPATPLLLALRAGLVQALDGQALDAWEQAFDSAARHKNLPVATLSGAPLLNAAMAKQDYKRAALIQHMLASTSAAEHRFHPCLQEALLLSKAGGFEESIDALLADCKSLASGVPERARFWLTSGEIRERQGDQKGAIKAWKRLIDLPDVDAQAPVLQARGLAFLGEAMLPLKPKRASALLKAAIDSGEALSDWPTVASAAQAWMPILRESSPEQAQVLAQRLTEMATRFAPHALEPLQKWLG